MRVHAERSSNGKVGVSLHDFDRENMGVNKTLNVAPAHPGLHPNRATQGRELDYSVKISHVQMQAARAGRLTAHAEPAASDRDRSGGASNCVLDLLDGCGCDDGPNQNRIESGNVIDNMLWPLSPTMSGLRADDHIASAVLERVLAILILPRCPLQQAQFNQQPERAD